MEKEESIYINLEDYLESKCHENKFQLVKKSLGDVLSDQLQNISFLLKNFARERLEDFFIKPGVKCNP